MMGSSRRILRHAQPDSRNTTSLQQRCRTFVTAMRLDASMSNDVQAMEEQISVTEPVKACAS